jgi:tetratricopeptide (TPR) repeat protein
VKEQTPPIKATDAKRRSTRVALAVPLVITWPGTQESTRVEETATLSINCHGCRYFSRHRPKKGAKIRVQVADNKEVQSLASQQLEARVAWIRKSRRLDGYYQVGVEFETPLNIWPVEQAPEDWETFSPPVRENPASLMAEVERLLQFASTGTHYQLLEVQVDTPGHEVKSRFYRLARRFHPDHHMDHPERIPQLVTLMDALNNAYRILSDGEAKAQYDANLRRIAEQQSEPKRLARQYLEKAQECLAEQNYIGSILWLRRAIENEPNSSSYRAMLGLSLAHVPEYRREAVEQFEIAFELDPSNLTAHLYYARVLEKMNMPWRARPHYIRVLELDINHVEARDRLNRLDAGAPRLASRPSLLGRLTGRR